MAILYKYKIYCETDARWEYVWKESTEQAPSVCPVDPAHAVRLDSISIVEKLDQSVQSVEVASIPVFAAKTIGDKKLYKRVVGIRAPLIPGANDVLWTCTFPWVKFAAIEVIGAELGDYVSLFVLDTITGTYSTIPSQVLNQFGFTANLAKDFYEHKSEFDADLYQGLQIKIVYQSLSAKSVGINLIMNELKS